jgi:hypothetical protein
MTTLESDGESFEISGVYATHAEAMSHCKNDRMAFIEFEVGMDVSDITAFRVYSLAHPNGIMTHPDH